MKKQIISASVIALMVLASSCAKNEVLSGIPDNDNVNVEQISFRSTASTSRANDNGLTELEGGFNVIGLKADGEYITGFADPSGDAQTYWKTAGAWAWKTTPTGEDKKWPAVQADYPLTFFMAYPLTEYVFKDGTKTSLEVAKNMTPDATYSAGNTYSEKVAVPVDATAVSVDYLGAKAVVVSKPASGFADLSFKHIMSNILFEVEVPTGVKAVIHSIKIANVKFQGPAYDYKAQEWATDPSSAGSNLTHFAHYIAPTAADAQMITKAAAVVKGFSDGAAGFNTIKLIPQANTTPWALGAEAPDANTFRFDAKAWATKYPTVDATAIEAWHMKAIADTEVGMKDSKGWDGARIEVIYCLVDETNGKNLIGRFNGVDGATATQFVRVGYALDIPALVTKAVDGTNPAIMGLAAGYKYTFRISLGTADATNGILLDPDYKDENGGSTDQPVDNPKTTPGDDVTKGGLIEFNVGIDAWADYTGNIK